MSVDIRYEPSSDWLWTIRGKGDVFASEQRVELGGKAARLFSSVFLASGHQLPFHGLETNFKRGNDLESSTSSAEIQVDALK